MGIKTDMDKYKKICLYFKSSVPFCSPPGIGLSGSSRFHQEAPEQNKSTARIPVQNKREQLRARKERQLGH